MNEIKESSTPEAKRKNGETDSCCNGSYSDRIKKEANRRKMKPM
jgi:hypothetical protein